MFGRKSKTKSQELTVAAEEIKNELTTINNPHEIAVYVDHRFDELRAEFREILRQELRAVAAHALESQEAAQGYAMTGAGYMTEMVDDSAFDRAIAEGREFNQPKLTMNEAKPLIMGNAAARLLLNKRG